MGVFQLGRWIVQRGVDPKMLKFEASIFRMLRCGGWRDAMNAEFRLYEVVYLGSLVLG